MVELPEEVASYDYGLKTAEEAKAEAIGELFFLRLNGLSTLIQSPISDFESHIVGKNKILAIKPVF